MNPITSSIIVGILIFIASFVVAIARTLDRIAFTLARIELKGFPLKNLIEKDEKQ